MNPVHTQDGHEYLKCDEGFINNGTTKLNKDDNVLWAIHKELNGIRQELVKIGEAIRDTN